jgi:hypothetical protein
MFAMSAHTVTIGSSNSASALGFSTRLRNGIIWAVMVISRARLHEAVSKRTRAENPQIVG